MINDLSNHYVIDLLKHSLSEINDPAIIKNYHPDYSNTPGNLFYILSNGRYQSGTYYVVEEGGKYVCSAGWNRYCEDHETALLLTRAYIPNSHRSNYLLSKYLLQLMIGATVQYKKVWITCNEHNRSIYRAFERLHLGNSAGLFNQWPDIYKKFKPIGVKTIYSTQQYVVEYEK
jgi:hypothetical protein